VTFDEFDKFQDDLLKEVKNMGATKGKEYANSKSRFANFTRLSERLNIKPTAVALVYLTKHMDAIESYISRGRTYSTETIQGRIVDAITYLTLIAGMVEEADSTQQEAPIPPDFKGFKAESEPVMLGENIGKQQPFEYSPTTKALIKDSNFCEFCKSDTTNLQEHLDNYHLARMPYLKR
jgi:hypothetical protein